MLLARGLEATASVARTSAMVGDVGASRGSKLADKINVEKVCSGTERKVVRVAGLEYDDGRDTNW